MSFNIEKCHQLTVIKKRNRIPTSYTLHNQTLERVASTKYLGVEFTENLHWGNTSSPLLQKPARLVHLHTGTLKDAHLLSRHIATKALCFQC